MAWPHILAKGLLSPGLCPTACSNMPASVEPHICQPELHQLCKRGAKLTSDERSPQCDVLLVYADKDTGGRVQREVIVEARNLLAQAHCALAWLRTLHLHLFLVLVVC